MSVAGAGGAGISAEGGGGGVVDDDPVISCAWAREPKLSMAAVARRIVFIKGIPSLAIMKPKARTVMLVPPLVANAGALGVNRSEMSLAPPPNVP